MFAIAAQPTVRAAASVKATKVAAKEQKSATLSSKAAGAAAALFLLSSPAALAGDGLVLLNSTNKAPGKYTQPFFDPRPVVIADKVSSADIGTEASRIAPNVRVGAKDCKTITGAPCEAASQVTMQ